MTLVEFLHPIKDKGLREVCLAAMYFHERMEKGGPLSVDGLRSLLKRGRLPRVLKLNFADTLAKSAPYVTTVGKEGHRFLWSLTTSGQDYVRTLLGLPAEDIEKLNDVSSLQQIAAKIGDPDVADYVNEAIDCLKVNALRASVVFLWAGAIKKLRTDAFAVGPSPLNAAIIKFDPKAKPVTKEDDLVLIKESTLLLAVQELGLVDKNQRGVLEDCLNLRNKCGHPGKYKVGEKKVSSFIEDVIGIVF